MNKSIFSQTIELYVITYNRAELLKETLNKILSQLSANIKLTVLDNNSSDDTNLIVNFYQKEHNNLFYAKNIVNIGLGGNILRPFELASAKYLWILGDDDDYVLSNLDFLISVLEQNDYPLVHVGAHGLNWEYGNIIDEPEQLIMKGYPYFKFGSFIGCNIFNRKKFMEDSLQKAYENIFNVYPHMPFIHKIYLDKSKIYISEYKYVNALANQSYSSETWIRWWVGNALSISDRKISRIVFLNHFNNKFSDDVFYLLKIASQNPIESGQIKYFLQNCLTHKEKILFATLKFRTHTLFGLIVNFKKYSVSLIYRLTKSIKRLS